jgi:hypothetical protein
MADHVPCHVLPLGAYSRPSTGILHGHRPAIMARGLKDQEPRGSAKLKLAEIGQIVATSGWFRLGKSSLFGWGKLDAEFIDLTWLYEFALKIRNIQVLGSIALLDPILGYFRGIQFTAHRTALSNSKPAGDENLGVTNFILFGTFWNKSKHHNFSRRNVSFQRSAGSLPLWS